MTEQMRKIDTGIVLYVGLPATGTKTGLFLIENEFHLIVECEYYATLRNTYLKSEYLINYIRFIELFTSTDKSILFNLATFLYKSLLLRSNVGL